MAKTKKAAVVAKAGGLVLVREGSHIALHIGERVEDFHGEKWYLRSVEAPLHNASSGRVFVSASKTGSEHRFYPSVINAAWMPEGVWSRAQQPTVKPAAKNAPACSLCESAWLGLPADESSAATLRVTVTTLDGTVLDSCEVCHQCAAGGLDALGLVAGKAGR